MTEFERELLLLSWYDEAQDNWYDYAYGAISKEECEANRKKIGLKYGALLKELKRP